MREYDGKEKILFALEKIARIEINKAQKSKNQECSFLFYQPKRPEKKP